MALASQLRRSLLLTAVLWLLTVVVVTLPLLGLGRLVAPDQASGSLVRHEGRVIGSRLIGQPFTDARHLQGRPAGAADLAASNPTLARRVEAAAQRWQAQGVAAPAADLLLDSGSGVDPQISLQAARQQLPGLTRSRGLAPERLEALLQRHRQGPWRLRAIEPVIDVLGFNLELDQLSAAAAAPVRSTRQP
ncbi:MAG: potassium-transporting ATPase subunit C [Synechococcaceae cyanobacterium]|nr:potassium-transporting ATPase subunit C [Synechococcaceae cyanobacterium]